LLGIKVPYTNNPSGRERGGGGFGGGGDWSVVGDSKSKVITIIKDNPWLGLVGFWVLFWLGLVIFFLVEN
jgi:hypothetical protein